MSAAAVLASLAPLGRLHAMPGAGVDRTPLVCIFSKCLQWLDYREMTILAAEMGFSGIDLTVRKGGHVLPENVRRDLPRAVSQIRDAGLEVPMITTGITRADDPFTLDILETAGKLGIRAYRPGWYRYADGMTVQDSIRQARVHLQALQAINEHNNIAASYQNHSGRFVGGSGWDLFNMIRELDPRWTGVQFDIRHAMVEGPDTWPMVLEILTPWINTIDIKDFTWDISDGLSVVSTPLGDGLVPWNDFFSRLRELGIRADYSIHYEYSLGGAEHGASELGISKAAFADQVSSDLGFFMNHVNLKGNSNG